MSISGQPPEDRPTPLAPDGEKEHLQNFAQEAAATLNDAKEQGAEQYENIRDFATEQIDSLVEGAQSAASALEGKDSLGLSQYLGKLASDLGSFADQVRDKSAEDLLHKGAQLARDNPTLFMAGSVAIGFGLSRFLRASGSHGDETAPSASAPRRDDSSVGPVAAQLPDDYLPSRNANSSAGAVADPLGEAATYPVSDNNVRGAE